MDKYTVDLDQVLNDFEYSELTTDNHGFEQSRNNKHRMPPPPPNPAYSFKNTNVKHSINNVFHSLNEYLNTEITPKTPPAGESSLANPHSTANHHRNLVANVQTTPSPKVETIEEPKLQETVATVATNEEAEGETIEGRNGEVTVQTSEGPEVETIEGPKVETIEAPKVETVEGPKVETVEGPKLETVEGPKVETIEGQDVEKVEDPKAVTNEETEVETIESLQPVTQEELEPTVESPKTEVASQLVEMVGETEMEVSKLKEEKTEDLVLVEVKSSCIETIDRPVEEKVEELVEREEGKTVEVLVDDDVVKVGFTEDIDLDESELNKYLEELEKEFESREVEEVKKEEEKELEKSFDIVQEETVEESKGRTETEEEETKEDNNLHSRPKVLSLPTNSQDEVKGVINLIGDPGSTPYNNVYINKELPARPKQKNADNSSDNECSTSASPTFSDVSTETTSSCTSSTDTVNDDNTNIETTTTNNQNGESESDVNPEVFHDAVEEQVEEVGRNLNGESGEATGGATEETVAVETATRKSDAIGQGDWLGKQAPLWIPDGDALNCLHCDMKFTVIKRRHHCRACGFVLCSKCCNLKYRLEYLDDVARVCSKCYDILTKDVPPESSGSESNSPRFVQPQPNPNNPAEYCSTVPPHQQVGTGNPNPPSVMVPVGVLKRKGSGKSRTNKSVMFCDGIRPGSDLTNLDSDFGYTEKHVRKVEEISVKKEAGFPEIDAETKSFIPKGDGLPPTATVMKTDVSYSDCPNNSATVETLRKETVTFCIQTNLLVHLKIVNMECCINKLAWCFSTEGLINVGQDEIVILLELLDDETIVPKDVFLHINNIYRDAVKGTSVKEMGLSLHNTPTFLGSKNHVGFVFIRPTFQCLQNVIKPTEPYLIGILIHRWETPWAKLFPLRLILRLGAEYRYYPSPIISNRYRDSVFVEIGHTIINLLADFRNFSYSLPQIRGLTIHMEDKNTTVTIPLNRYDQVMKSMNNSSDHILAFAGNFSSQADSHLVCIQDTQSNENAYSTHAINIHNKPRKVTGASFIVFNGALKSSSGLTAKSSIVEDGLMIQIPPEQMVQIRESLRNMKNYTIQCGCVNAASDETVSLIWGEADTNFNINIVSPIDNQSMGGIPSIRVHNGKDYVCNSGNRLIRWTEVFIIQNADESCRNQDPVDISKVSESIAKATCNALVKYLDLLVSNNFHKIGIRTTLHLENVMYSAGSNAMKLPPIYMKSLDNELIPVLHRITSNNFSENAIILELIFRILNK